MRPSLNVMLRHADAAPCMPSDLCKRRLMLKSCVKLCTCYLFLVAGLEYQLTEYSMLAISDKKLLRQALRESNGLLEDAWKANERLLTVIAEQNFAIEKCARARRMEY